MSRIDKKPKLNEKHSTGNKSDNSPFDDLAPEYDAWFDGEGNRIFLNEVKAFRTLLPSLPRPWLEIGIGSGRFAQALGINTGIDPSGKLVEIARSRKINAVLGRGEKHLFDAESFGTIFLIVTLCFLDKPLVVLREASRILAPGGKIAIGLVLKESPWGKFYQQKKEEGHRFYKYAKFYSYCEVVKLMFRAGFMGNKTVSTLMQKPEDVKFLEEPKAGYYPDAGFTILVGVKNEKLHPISRRR